MGHFIQNQNDCKGVRIRMLRKRTVMLVPGTVLGLQSYYDGKNSPFSSKFCDNHVDIFSLQFEVSVLLL